MWSVGSVDRNIIWNLETKLFVEHSTRSTLNDNSTSIPSACVAYSTSLPPGTVLLLWCISTKWFLLLAICYFHIKLQWTQQPKESWLAGAKPILCLIFLTVRLLAFLPFILLFQIYNIYHHMFANTILNYTNRKCNRVLH